MKPDEEKGSSTSRRCFLTWLILSAGALMSAALGVPAVGFLLDPVLGGKRRYWVPLGPADRFKVGETVAVSFENPLRRPWSGDTGKSGVWLRRTGNDAFTAFVINCSHLGCPVRWEPSSRMFMCPCHGGVYYEDGTVAAGPPPLPLQKFRVRIANGQVEVETRPIPIT